MDERIVARHGDYSARSFLSVERTGEGIILMCVLDQHKSAASTPHFCGANAGGRSLATRKVLWQLYHQLPTDELGHGILASEKNDGSSFIIVRSDDIIISTQDIDGEYGAQVLVTQNSPHFGLVFDLFRAIQIDNEAHSLWDARRLCP